MVDSINAIVALLKRFFGFTTEPEKEPEEAPVTMVQTLVSVEQGLTYILHQLDAHGVNIETLGTDLNAAITDLFALDQNGTEQPVILDHIRQAIAGTIEALKPFPKLTAVPVAVVETPPVVAPTHE